jgi:hypothetical protein
MPASRIAVNASLMALFLACTAGCSGRYVGPGSGTRDARSQQRTQQHAESTERIDPVASPQEQRAIDASGLPVAP